MENDTSEYKNIGVAWRQQTAGNPMGETKKNVLRVGFDQSLKLEFHGSKVTSDAERLCVDSTMRHVVVGRAKWRNAASRTPMLKFALYLLIAVFIEPDAPSADPHLIAHRGLCQHAPENTLPALAAAVSLGFGVEVDVYPTKDEQLVLIHDKTVDRTTDGTGKVVEKTLAELKSHDAGSWFDPAYAGLKIPTFDEALAVIRARR